MRLPLLSLLLCFPIDPRASAQEPSAAGAMPTESAAQPASPAPNRGQALGEALPRRGTLGISFTPLPGRQAEAQGLSKGEGLVARAPLAGSTSEKLGFREGDKVLRLNGQPVRVDSIGRILRETPAGTQLAFEVLRGESKQTLSGPLLEKPRDPGTEEYEVIYSHVVNGGERMRTILTKPRKPGPHPGFLFIQGFSPVSYDFVLSSAKGDVTSLDGPLLHRMASSGFVTLRVEKPGVGDSEGGPFEELDYHAEIGIYREALAQLKSTPGVDPQRVFVFGHSMGGSFGPMVVADDPVAGIAVYGTAGRTWFEYLLDTIRYQGLVGGASFEQADDAARQGAHVMALVMLDGRSPEQVKAEQPDLAPLVDAYFPGGMFSGKTLEFWRQLAEINFASYWSRLECDVLAVKGASDFVVYEADHKLIADIVNRAHPGRGRFVVAPDSDHLLHAFATEPESMQNFQKGQYSPVLENLLLEWTSEILKRG